ncbi:MAG: DUF4364 family protein [Firmicutes bacterium]|nr:DUF4364 family protein [Bacillota bacterium]
MYMREVDDPVIIQYIILFTLTKANRKVTHSQLTCLTLDACNINFTNFQIALDNLVQIDYIKKLTNELDEKMPIYQLTEKGEQANGFFEHSIPIYIREQIEEHIEPYFEQERLKKSVKAKLAPINDREYNVECALYESISPLMEMTFYAGPRDVAAQMIRTFKSKPDVVYKKILNALLDETHENEK